VVEADVDGAGDVVEGLLGLFVGGLGVWGMGFGGGGVGVGSGSGFGWWDVEELSQTHSR